ncbi:MAG: DUF4276 family protein [Mariprofundaceae bacterium]|nr:DUF4276 family protein [Mariprofundaceae bacterium]
MTRKLAVFVEGLTEQEFTIRLLTELASNYLIEFKIHKQHRGHLIYSELRSTMQTGSPSVQVLIANCCNDEQVKSQIIDQYASLTAAGYDLIIGLRDVYPLTHNDINKLTKHLLTGIPNGNVPVHLHLAILEIEAWFIEESSHFSRIDKNITTSQLASVGIDSKSLALSLKHPAKTLDLVYQSVGKRYNKNKRQIQRTIDALSYEELYVNTRHKAPSLDGFIKSLEEGLILV